MPKIQQPEASVGLLVGVREQSKPAVLLQVRAADDSYPGGAQVSAHGKLTQNEIQDLDERAAFSAALGRKLREELGQVAAEMIEASQPRIEELTRVVNSKGRLVVTFGVDLAQEATAFRQLIVPGEEVGGFRAVTNPEIIAPLEDGHREAGVPAHETRMFPDEINAVKRFFLRFFKTP